MDDMEQKEKDEATRMAEERRKVKETADAKREEDT